MHITFVKKILISGELCKKCQEVSERLSSEELIEIIDHISIADERDIDSEVTPTPRQPMIELFVLTSSRFLLRKSEEKCTPVESRAKISDLLAYAMNIININVCQCQNRFTCIPW